MPLKNSTRRTFLKSIGLAGGALYSSTLFSCGRRSERPNILWITSEDNGPFLGCYGDELATTPNLDKMASEGILYENAFATAPVCAPARCTIITGVYPPSMGTQHMRSRYPIPDFIKPYPLFLRQAGYYCTNNVKTDYNFAGDDKSYWDESSRQAHYKNRAQGQPFFAIFNITVSHESSIHKPEKELRHDPARVKLPPYHPDTPEIRHDWAQYYDKVEDMDRQVGKILQELEDSGLAEETIVFYYADHGGVLPRSKRFIYDSGLRVPFIVRFPQKYRHLSPHEPGSRTDRIVTFADLAPTLLSLAGIPKPKVMQGHAFLGKYAEKPREYAFSFRGRMDERYDFSRTLRDKTFRYIRNYNPHRIYAQYIEYLWRAPAMRSWEKEFRAGRCNEVQSRFWRPKPAEELYKTAEDPWEVNNLAEDPAYADVLKRMRQACRDYMLKIRDSGFIPEGVMVEISEKGTIYEFVHSDAYPLERLLDVADKATSRKEAHRAELIRLADDGDQLIRFWAVTGLLILGAKDRGSREALLPRLEDACGDVRVTAAEALCHAGEVGRGLPVLIEELANPNTKVALRAANALEFLDEAARPALSALKAQFDNPDRYVQRAVRRTVAKLEKL